MFCQYYVTEEFVQKKKKKENKRKNLRKRIEEKKKKSKNKQDMGVISCCSLGLKATTGDMVSVANEVYLFFVGVGKLEVVHDVIWVQIF